MRRGLISPGKYIQGPGELYNLGNYANNYGHSLLVIASATNLARTREALDKSMKSGNIEITYENFNGECSQNEINRLIEVLKNTKSDIVAGIGGGKVLDTAKAVADSENKAMISVPTIAATDAPCSALAVLYTEEGIFEKVLLTKRNPDLVLVDSTIIARAPVRYLISGMGDALATYFEARSSYQSNSDNIAGFKSTNTAMALAELCYETLMEDSIKSIAACKNDVVTPALENIIEANILLSGLGFESGGLAAAHSIHNGFTILKECHNNTHGEKVAFGTIVHLVLENAPLTELEEVIDYCLDVGLPVCLEDLGCENVSREELRKVSEKACSEEELIHNMPFKVTPEDVFAAILAADELGKELQIL